jgi:AcrR family transcriptional regulator
MSRNAQSKPGKADVRIRRTHERLGSALVALIQDFRDKNDLLLSQLETFLGAMSGALATSREASDKVVPVTELFSHIGSQRTLYRALADAGRLHDFLDLAQGYFARGIEQRLKECQRRPSLPPSELAAHAFALPGSLLSLLQWWLDRGANRTPRAMDELFHRMVWNGLA